MKIKKRVPRKHAISLSKRKLYMIKKSNTFAIKILESYGPL